jgi:hypothetical protein
MVDSCCSSRPIRDRRRTSGFCPHAAITRPVLSLHPLLRVRRPLLTGRTLGRLHVGRVRTPEVYVRRFRTQAIRCKSRRAAGCPPMGSRWTRAVLPLNRRAADGRPDSSHECVRGGVANASVRHVHRSRRQPLRASHDGKRFLLSVGTAESSAAQIVVVLNWADNLASIPRAR